MDPFIGEISLFSFSWPPRNWAICNGSSLPVASNQALYALIGNQYGGNSINFNIPDLRGRVPLQISPYYNQGTYGGDEYVALNKNNLPAHNHILNTVNETATLKINSGDGFLANTNEQSPLYSSSQTNLIPLNTNSISYEGKGAAHYNMQPYIALNFCIALQGIFPSRQ